MHLFYLGGYYLVLQYFIDRSGRQLIERLDNNQYDDSELTEIKVALHLPYVTNYGYMRIDGEIEMDGIHYNYVKRKIEGDTLYMLCLPNKDKTKLVDARSRFTEQSNDIAANGKKNNTTAKKFKPVSEFNQLIASFVFHNRVELAKHGVSRVSPHLINPFIESSCQPPDQQGA